MGNKKEKQPSQVIHIKKVFLLFYPLFEMVFVFRMFFFSVTKSQRVQREMNTKMLFQFLSKSKLFKNIYKKDDVYVKNFIHKNLFQQNLINSNLIRIIR